MNKNIFFFLFSIVLIFIGCQQSGTNQYQQNNGNNVALPSVEQFIIKYLGNNYPKIKLATTANYDDLWWSFYEKDETYSFKAIELNNDKKLDYCFFAKENNTLKLFFLVTDVNNYKLLEAKEIQYKSTKSDKFLSLGIFPEPPGRIDVLKPIIQSLILKNNGVAIMEYENVIAIYYIENNQLKLFKTR